MKRPLTWSLSCALGLCAFADDPPSTTSEATVVLVIGAPGAVEYATPFRRWAEGWRAAAELGGARFVTIGLTPGREPAIGEQHVDSTPLAPNLSVSGDAVHEFASGAARQGRDVPESEPADLTRLEQRLKLECDETARPLWLVLIGHGTFDGKHARFNLRGPDLTAKDLAGMLEPLRRPVAVIHCAAGSAPFIAELSGSDRVVVAATRSGYELNYARFGRFMAESIASPEADLDGDGQTSLLEAFLMASRRVTEFYETDGRIVTEHALIDDNGDKRGTPAEWFRGIRVVKEAADGALADGSRAHQWHLVGSPRERAMSLEVRERRDELELSIARLRARKETLDEEIYYRRLENILLQLALIYDEAESGER